MKKAKLVYGKSYIFGFFFWYEEFSHSTVIPLSFRFLTNSPHSTVILLIRFPLIPLSFPSFGFPSFPYHSPVHSISPHSPLIPLSFGFPSFPSFGFSNSPVIPLIPLGFPSFGFPSCIPSSLSAVLSWLFSLGSLSLPLFSLGSLSPFPCSLKKQDNITDSRGKGQEG